VAVFALFGLAGAGFAGYWLGKGEGARATLETHAAVPEPTVNSETERARQRAWHEVANTLVRSGKTQADAGTDSKVPSPEASADPTHEDEEIAPAEAKRVTPVEERDNAVARVRASGPDQKRLFSRAQAVGDVWEALAKKRETPAQVGRWECHAAGCLATIVQKSESEIEDLTNDLSREEAFRGWEGPKMRSGPIKRPDGSTEVTWILYSSDEDARGNSQPKQ
jgi:hypothetical protein